MRTAFLLVVLIISGCASITEKSSAEFRSGNYRKAIEMVDSIPYEDSQYGEAQFIIGAANLKLGRLGLAKDHCDRCLGVAQNRLRTVNSYVYSPERTSFYQNLYYKCTGLDNQIRIALLNTPENIKKERIAQTAEEAKTKEIDKIRVEVKTKWCPRAIEAVQSIVVSTKL